MNCIALMKECQSQNKFRLQFYLDEAIERSDVDIVHTQIGNKIEIDPVSVKALQEFENLIPTKIDRYIDETMPVQHIWRDSFGVIQSNKSWSERRKTILKIIGINFASQYISMMIKTVDDWAKQIPIGKEVDFNFELSGITYTIISKILFGRDIENAEKFGRE